MRSSSAPRRFADEHDRARNSIREYRMDGAALERAALECFERGLEVYKRIARRRERHRRTDGVGAFEPGGRAGWQNGNLRPSGNQGNRGFGDEPVDRFLAGRLVGACFDQPVKGREGSRIGYMNAMISRQRGLGAIHKAVKNEGKQGFNARKYYPRKHGI